jgi:ATP-dependent HslUV protease, peptidase subunit HslV
MPSTYASTRRHGTTILAVKRGGTVALAGDGQVTFGDVVVKHGARKIRRLYEGEVLAGFAGAVADALTLIERFEGQLETWRGNLRKAAVEMAKDWRTDRALRRLEAELIVADRDSILLLSGDGDVLEPDENVIAIGAGGAYAAAAAQALLAHTHLSAPQIVEAALRVTARLCIYTNDTLLVEVVGDEADGADGAGEPGPAADGASAEAADQTERAAPARAKRGKRAAPARSRGRDRSTAEGTGGPAPA